MASNHGTTSPTELNILEELRTSLREIRDDIRSLQYPGERNEFLRRWRDLDNELHVRIRRNTSLKPMEPSVERLRKHVKDRLKEWLKSDYKKNFGSSSKQ